MSARTASALKASIEQMGLGLTCYIDRPRQGTPLPYVTISDQISVVPDSVADKDGTVTELVQVDLWQQWFDMNDKVVESPTLGRNLVRGLHKSQLLTAPNTVYGVLVVGARRMTQLQPDNVTHLAITCSVAQST